jgi:hypothetical protein
MSLKDWISGRKCKKIFRHRIFNQKQINAFDREPTISRYYNRSGILFEKYSRTKNFPEFRLLWSPHIYV